MQIPNQIYEFTPPGGEGKPPIVILGLQEYSPGQSRKVDLWRFEVPDDFVGNIPNGTEVTTFAVVERYLAESFCEGDQAAVRPLLLSRMRG